MAHQRFAAPVLRDEGEQTMLDPVPFAGSRREGLTDIKGRELTQTRIVGELHIGQGDVSKLERRTDMYVSTLVSYFEAVGADLEIRAVFPDGHAVRITQFSEESI
jgi:hypothetical protein